VSENRNPPPDPEAERERLEGESPQPTSPQPESVPQGSPGSESTPLEPEQPRAAGSDEQPDKLEEPAESEGSADAAPLEPAAASAAAPRNGLRHALAERSGIALDVPRRRLAAQSRRDFLLFSAGIVASATAAWWLLPDLVKARLLPGPWRDRLDTMLGRVGLSRGNRERALNGALTFDDDVAEALYSKNRLVRTYKRSQVTPLRNNYSGRTPGPEYLADWMLRLSGLASGRVEHLTIDRLRSSGARREQITRLVCVEGWSAIAWWGGIRFADLLSSYPPIPGARYAAIRSEVSLDSRGRLRPYYVSIDLDTARHSQTLLATEHDGRPLTLAHGAPLRLLAPMKLGLKNIKAITSIEYTLEDPPDYWNERGYSKYDGL